MSKQMIEKLFTKYQLDYGVTELYRTESMPSFDQKGPILTPEIQMNSSIKQYEGGDIESNPDECSQTMFDFLPKLF